MKRSAQVALVLMSTAAVGGTAYSMMPRENCVPATGVAPNAAAPNSAAPKAIGQSCTTSNSWGHYFRGGRPIFGAWNNSGSSTRTNFTSDRGTSTSTTTSRTASTGTQRGGFGSTASSISSRGG
jgi:hypothetical protein